MQSPQNKSPYKEYMKGAHFIRDKEKINNQTPHNQNAYKKKHETEQKINKCQTLQDMRKPEDQEMSGSPESQKYLQNYFFKSANKNSPSNKYQLMVNAKNLD